jgi:UDP-glucose 4-epimerase
VSKRHRDSLAILICQSKSSFTMNNILVTGGAGFVGSHLVKEIYRNNNITIIDDFSNVNVKQNALSEEMRNNISVYKENILNRSAVERIIRKEEIDICVHLAAKISVQDSIRNPMSTVECNVLGTQNLLEICSANNGKNFVFASSAAVYGEPIRFPTNEDHFLNPSSIYGASKAAGESLVSSYKNLGKITNGISLRFFNIFGIGQNPEYAGVITKFVERVSNGLAPIIYGDGEQTREFIDVKDIVKAITLAMKADTSDKLAVYNIAMSQPISINQLARFVLEHFRMNLDPVYENERAGDIRQAHANISRVQDSLHFKPSASVYDSLQNILTGLASKVLVLENK